MVLLKIIRIAVVFAICLLLSGCLFTYLVKSGYNQFKILNNRVPIEDVLKQKDLPPGERHKLELALEVRGFAANELHLRPTKSYTTFVDLHRPYVTWIVTAAEKDKLKQRPFWYPIVGSLPYKGFFNLADAKAQAEELKKKNLDVMLRGVTAYSTLGWFEDPLLSTMITGPDYDLVNVIIHESTHATIFVKSQADFNEELATYSGDLGTELFYEKKEGKESKTLKQIHDENADELLFSKFITKKTSELKKWYEAHPHAPDAERQQQFKSITADFVKSVKPNLKTKDYDDFSKMKLNNAVLLYLGTYDYDLSDFAKLYKKLGNDFGKFIQTCKQFESSKDPKADLKKMLARP